MYESSSGDRRWQVKVSSTDLGFLHERPLLHLFLSPLAAETVLFSTDLLSSPENPRLYSPRCFFAALPGPLFHDRIRSRVLSLLLRNLFHLFVIGMERL
ncbi:hypothetical protein L1987_69848 [Smallanthus sonchifolius]|uniref:Uncharacterized protein n=1 Tax=Smallanthus sonchifolius TaxID=185202 RepID=A0ACB9B7L4_9ASTR|nr:hypothetical protein L1987_69848 [Smallanthus sonchifolius]